MQLIYDVGAHLGEDTEYYLKKGFKVIAVEANSVLAGDLRKKFASQIEEGRLVIVESAIADKEGEIEFFVNEKSVWGTIYNDWADRNEKLGAKSKSVKVRAVRFESILQEHGAPYFVKIDIEGADMLCVRALNCLAAKPEFVSIESNKTSWQELREEFRVFEQLGYRRFKLVNQEQIESQREPSSPAEGVFAGHAFPYGSSGLFGNDLPGEWLTQDQALARYAKIFFKYRFFGDNTFGERLAKRLPWRWQKHLKPGWYDTHAAR